MSVLRAYFIWTKFGRNMLVNSGIITLLAYIFSVLNDLMCPYVLWPRQCNKDLEQVRAAAAYPNVVRKCVGQISMNCVRVFRWVTTFYKSIA